MSTLYKINSATLDKIAVSVMALRGVGGGLTPDEISNAADEVAANISDALTAIAEKGVDVPDGADSNDLARLIRGISQSAGETWIFTLTDGTEVERKVSGVLDIDISDLDTVSIDEGEVKKIVQVSDGAVIWERVYYSSVLEENTWKAISRAAAGNIAANYWDVGDRKSILVNGTIGTLSINTTYYVYILGFAHDGASGTIDFGTFKNAATSGKDICLIDGNYGNSNTGGAKYFNMNHSSKSAGWKICDMRYDILGSTDTSNGDASPTTAINPVANTLMAALPIELRSVMKPMTVYTQNSTDADITAVSATVDYLPLLAEFEVYGVRTNAVSTEQNYQRQYDYYAKGNSKIKNRHNSVNTGGTYWLRSQRAGYFEFCRIDASGNISTWDDNYSGGIAPIFRV